MGRQNRLIYFFINRLKQKLPGIDSQKKMAPILGDNYFRSFSPASNSKNSAVLVLLITNTSIEQIEVLLTLRSSNLNNHSGQICFPGGKSETGESFYQTALREANEEIGIDKNEINIIGELSELYVPPSNSTIHPVLAYTNHRPATINNEAEVEEVFFVELNSFINSKYYRLEQWKFDNYNVDVPLWNIHHSTPLWGATAMVLAELLDLYQEYLDTN